MAAEPRNRVEHHVIAPIAARWSPRAFSSRLVEREKLLSVLEAARWAASSFNEQPWRFIVAARSDPAAFEKVLACLKESNRSWAADAPVIMLVLAKKTFSNTGGVNKHRLYDAGQAVAQLSLQAVASELYVHQMAGILPDKARQVFAVPDDFEIVVGLALGYLGDDSQLPEDLRAKERRERKRKALSDLVFSGEFGQSAELVGARGGHHDPEHEVDERPEAEREQRD